MSSSENELKELFKAKLQEMMKESEVEKMMANPGYLDVKVKELHQFVDTEFKESSNEDQEQYRKMIDDQMKLFRTAMVPPLREEAKAAKEPEESPTQGNQLQNEPEPPKTAPEGPKVQMLSITQKLIKLLTEAYEQYLAKMNNKNPESPASKVWNEVETGKEKQLMETAQPAENKSEPIDQNVSVAAEEAHLASQELDQADTVEIDTVLLDIPNSESDEGTPQP